MDKIFTIVSNTCNKIKKEISSLAGVDCIDFIDIFPISPIHKTLLDNEAINIADLIEETERGNFYVFHKPIDTFFGKLKIIKIRKFDETRLNWEAAPDFKIKDFTEFKQRYINDSRFTYIEKPTYNGLEFKTRDSLVYFLEEPTTEYFKIK